MRYLTALAYAGKPGCQNAICRAESDGEGGWRCVGWHCSHCDEPCSSQGHRCEATLAAVKAAEDATGGEAS